MRTKTIERKRLPPTISKLARGERKGERFLLPNDPRGKEKGGENRKSGADGSGCSKLGSEKRNSGRTWNKNRTGRLQIASCRYCAVYNNVHPSPKHVLVYGTQYTSTFTAVVKYA